MWLRLKYITYSNSPPPPTHRESSCAYLIPVNNHCEQLSLLATAVSINTHLFCYPRDVP